MFLNFICTNLSLSHKPQNSLLNCFSGYREKVMTPEMALKAQLKSQKRKQQADEKREKDKASKIRIAV